MSNDIREQWSQAVRSRSTGTLLELASQMDDVDAVVSSGGGHSGTALVVSIEHRNIDLLRALIARGADVNKKDSQGRTPLMRAGAGHSSCEVIDLLCDSGARLEECDDGGRTALLCAAGANDSDTVRALLKRGANVNSSDSRGKTALMLAARDGDLPVVEVLVGAGANVRATDANGNSALAFAGAGGHTNIVNFLRRAGA